MRPLRNESLRPAPRDSLTNLSASTRCSPPFVGYPSSPLVKPSATCTKVQVSRTNVQFSVALVIANLLSVSSNSNPEGDATHVKPKNTFATVIRHYRFVSSRPALFGTDEVNPGPQ